MRLIDADKLKKKFQSCQVCLGHSDLSTTMRYAKIRDARKVVEETMSIEVF